MTNKGFDGWQNYYFDPEPEEYVEEEDDRDQLVYTDWNRSEFDELDPHICGNCGHYRLIESGIIEKCGDCGDDEIDLGMPTEIP